MWVTVQSGKARSRMIGPVGSVILAQVGSQTELELRMDSQIRTLEFKHVIVLTALANEGLPAPTEALELLVAAPGFEVCSEVLLDLRDVAGDISVTQVFKLASDMAQRISSLSREHRIAVLVKAHVPGDLTFNHAQFIELCADHAGLSIRAYGDHDLAMAWLGAAPEALSNVIPLARSAAGSYEASLLQFGRG